jgi:hypothetical protein
MRTNGGRSSARPASWAAQFNLEAQTVIAMRLMKIAGGGKYRRGTGTCHLTFTSPFSFNSAAEPSLKATGQPRAEVMAGCAQAGLTVETERSREPTARAGARGNR